MKALLLELPHYLIWSMGIFSTGAVFGAGTFFMAPEFTAIMLIDLSEFAGDVFAGSQREAFMFIFFNNVTKVFGAMMLGSLFAIVPTLSLIVNGFVLGLVFSYSLAATGGPLAFIAAVVPHGIFELPAFIVASAVGLLLGVCVIKRVRHEVGTSITSLYIWSGQLFIILIAPLLLVAAMIEVYVTPLVIHALIS
ncbi:MAG: stage II sporulation protein M [Candidatus Paceibacterota bacterium]